jgi:hypothetical protein
VLVEDGRSCYPSVDVLSCGIFVLMEWLILVGEAEFCLNCILHL